MVAPWQSGGNVVDFIRQSPGADRHKLVSCGITHNMYYLRLPTLALTSCKWISLSPRAGSTHRSFGFKASEDDPSLPIIIFG